MRDDDIEERLRRSLHAQLDGEEPSAAFREPNPRRLSRAPFGPLVAATSVVVVAVLVGSRLSGIAGGPAGRVGLAGASDSPPAIGSMAARQSLPPSPGASSSIAGPTVVSAGATSAAAAGTGGTAPATASIRVVPPPAPATPPPPARVTPAATQPPTPAAVVVTLADAGRMFHLAIGQQVSLQLGTIYRWSIDVGGSGVLAPVSARVPPDVQGVWMAERAGTAVIQAAGSPLCLQARPPCGMPSRVLTVTMVVGQGG